MNYIAKERVALAADGKTLVAFGSAEANSLFASKGATKAASQVKGLKNVSSFFDTDQPEPAPSKRVLPAADSAHSKPAQIKK